MSLPQNSQQPKIDLLGTECALLTGIGRSAIAVIGLRGDRADKIVDQCFDKATPAAVFPGQIRYGTWIGTRASRQATDNLSSCADPPVGESVIVTPISNHHFEIHCHGGRAAIERIINDLRESGVIRIDTHDWPRVDSILIAEAQQVLANCLTSRTAAVAMDQVRGAMKDWTVTQISLLRPPPATRPVGSLDRLRQETREILTFAILGTRLAIPFRVVLLGPPNVGKSSLVNAIVGYDRSITHDQPGTTRDVLHADTVIDGLPIRISDTAGIRENAQTIESEGIARARNEAVGADLVVRVTTPEPTAPGTADPFVFPGGEAPAEPQMIVVLNKCDLLTVGQSPPTGSIETNALTGDGVAGLMEAIASHFGRSMPPPGQPVPVTQRQADLLEKISRSATTQKSLNFLDELLVPQLVNVMSPGQETS